MFPFFSRPGFQVAFTVFTMLFLAGPALAGHAPDKVKLGITEYSNLKLDSDTHGKWPRSTTDHSKLKELQGPFASGPEVTRACLSCHNKAGHQFMKSIHWTWEYKNKQTGQMLGKKTLVNNFCTNARGNEGMCAQCHAGYGWKDDSFDFTKQENIDCLVCHDTTGTYYRTPTSKGNKACAILFEGNKPIDWTKVAQNVSLPKRRNCGSCHFFGGGGDGVKHGDLDSSLTHPGKDLDVHMDEKGLNFSCSKCHVSDKHIFAGSRYEMLASDPKGMTRPGLRRERASCQACHGNEPHPGFGLKSIKLNGHVDKIACQTCHIPTFARGGVATKIDWDWRTAGRLKNGVGYNEKGYTQGNGEHRKIYKSIKGSFKYGENLTPFYAWFNGDMRYTTIDTKFDPAKNPIRINSFTGAYGDPKSRIWPFKRMHTVQPYDSGNNTLVYMHLWGNDKDAFWGNYNFARAIKVGMAKYNKPYSGKFGFIDTVSFWPITHMVAPKEKALACAQCHAKKGRLAALAGFYMPGRDRWWWLDLMGWIAIFGALAVSIIHAIARYVQCKKQVTEECRDQEES